MRTCEMWRRVLGQDAGTSWRDDPEGKPAAGRPPPFGASMALARYFAVSDDAGTPYTVGGSSGGNGWAMQYVAKFRPGVPSHATAISVSLLDDDGARMNTLLVEL